MDSLWVVGPLLFIIIVEISRLERLQRQVGLLTAKAELLEARVPKAHGDQPPPAAQ